MGKQSDKQSDVASHSSSTAPSENTTAKASFSVDPLIFGLSMGFVVIFVVGAIALGDSAESFFAEGSDWILRNLNWLYIGGVSLSLIFLAVLFVSHFGRLRLGSDGERPEHSTMSWFAMLFAAGLGSVLMFYGVAEPINHMMNVPMQDAEPFSVEAINEAMAFTMYHFGIHMWVIFALPGLALGYFIYKRHLPPRVSSVFAPILGRWIYRWPGKVIDALSIIGTVFGIGVSVSLGTLQINSGLAKVFGAPMVAWVQVAIIVVITIVAGWSVASGLNKGIKVLSNLNIVGAVLLMLFVLATGPTLLLLRGTMDTASLYAEWLPKVMFWSDAQDVNPGWQGKWTVFYWAWTICWSPFVGMFLARISRGRTVREFIGGVLVLPMAFSIIWFAVFGFAGIDLELNNPGILTNPVVVDGDISEALFGLLENYPWTTGISIFALIIVALFFVTSIDSSAMINDMFAVGEENKTPAYYRLAWASVIGAVAAAILVMSPDAGIETLQNVAIIIGLPFFLINFVMMYSVIKGMNDDHQAIPEPVTRQWERTDSEEKLVEHESRPAPGYDEDGNILPRLEYDEEGNIVLPGNVRVRGDLGVDGEVDHDPEPLEEKAIFNQDGDRIDEEGYLVDKDGNRLEGEPRDDGPEVLRSVERKFEG